MTTPLKRCCSINAACSAVLATIAPPSPVVMFLLGWKLKQTRSPKLPILRPCQADPMACAASSMTRSPCPVAIRYRRSWSTGRPAKCTGSTAQVRGPMAASDLVERQVARVKVHIHEHRSRADPQDHVCRGAPAERRRDHFIARSDVGHAKCNLKCCGRRWSRRHAHAGRPPKYVDNASSNSMTRGPLASQPERSTVGNALDRLFIDAGAGEWHHVDSQLQFRAARIPIRNGRQGKLLR